MSARITRQHHGALTVLRPGVPLIEDAAGSFRDDATDAIRACAGRVAFDLSGAPYLDSDGIECLLDIADALGAAGQPARLIAVNETVDEALRITGARSAFRFFDEPADAARDLA